MNQYWVNWIYMSEGKACHGFFSNAEITLKKARKGVEEVKKNEKDLVCVWITRTKEQPDGSLKKTGTPHMEAFVDAFGNRT